MMRARVALLLRVLVSLISVAASLTPCSRIELGARKNRKRRGSGRTTFLRVGLGRDHGDVRRDGDFIGGRWLKSWAGTPHPTSHRLHLVFFRSSILAFSAAILGMCVTAPAQAQAPLASPAEGATTRSTPSPSSPPAPSSSDLRPTIGAVAAIGGVVMGGLGAVLFATAPASSPVPPAACCTGDAPTVPFNGARFGGAGLMGSGLALAAMGVPLYFATASRPAKPHRSEERMTGGVVLTTLGLGFLGAGTGVILNATNKQDMPNTPSALFLGGSILFFGSIFTSVGIPLWVSGASPPPGSVGRRPFVYKPEVSLGLRSVGLRFQF